jgi:hypothetical protein
MLRAGWSRGEEPQARTLPNASTGPAPRPVISPQVRDDRGARRVGSARSQAVAAPWLTAPASRPVALAARPRRPARTPRPPRAAAPPRARLARPPRPPRRLRRRWRPRAAPGAPARGVLRWSPPARHKGSSRCASLEPTCTTQGQQQVCFAGAHLHDTRAAAARWPRGGLCTAGGHPAARHAAKAALRTTPHGVTCPCAPPAAS